MGKRKNTMEYATLCDDGTFVKKCSNGVARYYCETVVGENVTQTEITQEQFISGTNGNAPTGCPSSGYHELRFPQKWIRGTRFSGRTLSVGKAMGVPEQDIVRLQKLQKARGSMLMMLKHWGVPVNDPNNMFEIVIKFAKRNPWTGNEVDNITYRDALQALSGVKKIESFDWGNLIGGFVDMVTGIVDGVNAGNNAAYLQEWATAFEAYMRTDMGAIDATLNATQSNPGAWGGWGPQGALDMLLQFKRTSWQDLKNHITSWVNTHNNGQMPQEIKRLFDAQDELERDLRNMVAAQTATGGAGSGGQTNTGGQGKTDWGALLKQYLPWIIIGIAAIIILPRLLKRAA